MKVGNGMFVDENGNQIWFSTDLKNRPHKNWFASEDNSIELKGHGYRNRLLFDGSWELAENVVEFIDQEYTTNRGNAENQIGGDGSPVSDFLRVDLHAYCHREDGPAVIKSCGDRIWYQYGLRHREDGPAVERVDGSKEWWIEGRLHRTDGPAVERVDGSKLWWFNGRLHRVDGPAVDYTDGTKQWWLHGRLHREDGPACLWSNGDTGWYSNGIPVTEQIVMQRSSFRHD